MYSAPIAVAAPAPVAAPAQHVGAYAAPHAYQPMVVHVPQPPMAHQAPVVYQPQVTYSAQPAWTPPAPAAAAPVQYIPHAPQPVMARTHVVAPGETLYSIAANEGIHWKSLLQRNGLQSVAQVQTGVTLRLEP